MLCASQFSPSKLHSLLNLNPSSSGPSSSAASEAISSVASDLKDYLKSSPDQPATSLEYRVAQMRAKRRRQQQVLADKYGYELKGEGGGGDGGGGYMTLPANFRHHRGGGEFEKEKGGHDSRGRTRDAYRGSGFNKNSSSSSSRGVAPPSRSDSMSRVREYTDRLLDITRDINNGDQRNDGGSSVKDLRVDSVSVMSSSSSAAPAPSQAFHQPSYYINNAKSGGMGIPAPPPRSGRSRSLESSERENSGTPRCSIPRRSPSMISDCSTLEPIPEDESGPIVYSATAALVQQQLQQLQQKHFIQPQQQHIQQQQHNFQQQQPPPPPPPQQYFQQQQHRQPGIPTRRSVSPGGVSNSNPRIPLHLLGRSQSFHHGEQTSPASHRYDSHVQQQQLQFPPDSNAQDSNYGSLKRRKALRAASFTDLAHSNSNSRAASKSPTPSSSSFVANFQEGVATGAGMQQPFNRAGSSISLQQQPQQADYSHYHPQQQLQQQPWGRSSNLGYNSLPRKWISESSLGPSRPVVVKECPCGNKIQFDPHAENNNNGDGGNNVAPRVASGFYDSDYGSFDRRTANQQPSDAMSSGVFRAMPASTEDQYAAPAPPPPRPPPPSDWRLETRPAGDRDSWLSRSQSLCGLQATGGFDLDRRLQEMPRPFGSGLNYLHQDSPTRI